MKSGGFIISGPKFDPAKVVDTNQDRTLEFNELQQGVRDAQGNVVSVGDYDWVKLPDGTMVQWKDIREYYRAHPGVGRPGGSAANVSPQQIRDQQVAGASREGQQVFNELAILDRAKAGNTNATLPNGATITSGQLDSAIAARVQRLQTLITLMQQAGTPVSPDWLSRAQLPDSGGNGGGGTFRAMTMSPSLQQGPSGGAPAGAGARADGIGYPAGVGYGPYGPGMFGGLGVPTSAAYANALYMDGVVSDGLGNVLHNSSEGRKLMMLFFYYARMAESGDLGAMYQFMKFITHILAKDKARQNIQIGTKLIQLQDLDRKATEALMAAPSDDPNKMNEFTKVLQQTQSEQRMIATSQKLMADMSQEFATVTESLIGMTKAVQEAWARALRIETSR